MTVTRILAFVLMQILFVILTLPFATLSGDHLARQLATFERRYYKRDTVQRSRRHDDSASQDSSVGSIKEKQIKMLSQYVIIVPENSSNPEPLPNKTYYAAQVANGVYYVAKNGYAGMFIVTCCEVVVVDAPPLVGTDFIDAIRNVTDLPVTHLIYSHHHIDHIGNATMFEKAEIIAQAETLRVLEDRQDPNRPLPTTVFTNNMTLNISGKIIQLDYHGPVHVPGNIFIWLPEEKVLFASDVVNTGWVPFTRLAVAEDVVAYLKGDSVVLSYDFDYLVAAHWGKLGTREDVLKHKEYMIDLQKFTLEGFQSVSFADAASKVKDQMNYGAILELYLQAINNGCKEKLEEKWKDVLGGVDIYSFANCDAVSMAQMIDYGMNVIE